MSGTASVKRVFLGKRLRQYHRRYLGTSQCNFNSIKNGILTNPNLHDVQIPKVSLPEYVFSKIEKFSEFTAFECPFTHKKYTFADVRKNSRNLSKALRKKFGLNNGDVALIYLPNSPEFPIAALGCLEAGVIASTVNSLYTPDEVARQLKDSSAKIIITCYEMYENAAKAVAQLNSKLPIICIKTKPDQSLPHDAVNFSELINTTIDIPDLELPKANDIAILPYSSGTTGLPKGVRLSHSNIVANLAQCADPDLDFMEDAHGTFQEISPGVLPMFHIYGFTVSTFSLMIRGAKVLTLPKFTPDTFIQVLKNNNVTIIFAAPPLVLFLTLHPEVKAEYFEHLKYIMSGAAPLGAMDEERFLKKAGKGVKISQGYGLTETSPVVASINPTIRAKFGEESSGSIGCVVVHTECKFVKPGDDSGIALGPNEQGELLVRGPQVMQGYHNNAEATKAAFLGDWLRTGDLAYYNENGLIFITDRVKELIKVKGFQVAPAELEELLRDHPKIADAAVIGIPHQFSGEVPRAYIQTKGDIDTEEIYNYVAEKVAKYKRLEGGIQLVKEIPKNSAGKILRRQLKKEYLDAQEG